MSKSDKSENKQPELSEGTDFYFENGLMVLTKEYHLRRGHCCKSGCRHCPYGFTAKLEKRRREEEK